MIHLSLPGAVPPILTLDRHRSLGKVGGATQHVPLLPDTGSAPTIWKEDDHEAGERD